MTCYRSLVLYSSKSVTGFTSTYCLTQNIGMKEEAASARFDPGEQASLRCNGFIYNSYKFFAVLYQTVNGCYAHSAIPVLAFRLATVITKMCGAMHFSYSAIIHQSGDSCLPFNIWQRVIKKDNKESIIHATSSEVSRKWAVHNGACSGKR